MGSTLFGWGCLVLAFGPWSQNVSTPVPEPLTTTLLKRLSAHLLGPYPVMHSGSSSVKYMEHNATVAVIRGKDFRVPYPLLQTGNSLLSLVAACIGGALGSFLAQRQRSQERRCVRGEQRPAT